MEQSYCESILEQWELKLLDNSPVQVRTQKNIHTFAADVLEMHSKKAQLFYAQRWISFEDRKFFSVWNTDQ